MTLPSRLLILLTNDDGIDSPGLKASVRAALELGDVLVAAPALQQTAMGRAFRGQHDAVFEPVPFEVEGQSVPAFRLNASPASVVRHALEALCATRLPDLVISGINYGENLGSAITASGTVGAAMEAASRGIPSLAASLQMAPEDFLHHRDKDWSAAAHFVGFFAARLLAAPPMPDVDLLKLDVPDTATPETPWRLCRLSRQSYFHMVLDSPTPRSALGAGQIQCRVDLASLEPDSDVHALSVDRVVSVTPLSLDMTSRKSLESIHTWLDAGKK
ncbi:MAG: 5'/3'-nucleotidase SurE [Firmicutes bacterium]|nr:5'/3'-nucleotidase SurE [Bacillota bacterium]